MKINWTAAGLAVGSIFAGFGTGVAVGALWAGPALVKAHCFVAEPRGISWAVHQAGICDGMVRASKDRQIVDQDRDASAQIQPGGLQSGWFSSQPRP